MKVFNKAISCINSLISDAYFKEKFRLNATDFTRERCLTFDTTVMSILDLTKKSLQIGLNSLSMNFNLQPVSKQAFSLARQKVSHEAFRKLNDEIINTFYTLGNVKLFKRKYLLLAIDGSTLQLPKTEDLSNHFSKASNHCSETVMARTSILYDVLNKVALDVQVVPYKSSEKNMALQHLKWLTHFQSKIKKKIILLFDRGYPNCGLFFLLQKLGFHCVCRAHNNLNKSIIEQFDEKKTDDTFTMRVDSPSKRNTVRSWLEIEDKTNVSHLETKLRAVKCNGKILLTTLFDNKKIIPKDIYELYRKRWGIETAYRTIKIDTLIENFSGRKVMVIYQEVHATILIQNLSRMLEYDLENSLEKRECSFINHRVILGALKACLQTLLRTKKTVMWMLKKIKINWEKSYIDRHYPRNNAFKETKFRQKRLCYA